MKYSKLLFLLSLLFLACELIVNKSLPEKEPQNTFPGIPPIDPYIPDTNKKPIDTTLLPLPPNPPSNKG